MLLTEMNVIKNEKIIDILWTDRATLLTIIITD